MTPEKPRAAAAGLFCLLLLAIPPAGRAQPKILSIEVLGTQRPVELATRAGQRFDPERLEAEVRRLWGTGWFEDIRVEGEQTPAGVRLFFELTEKPRLYLRRVVFQPEKEERDLGLPEGMELGPVRAQRVATALRRRLLAEGYAEAAVEAGLIPAGFQQADLLLQVEPGPRYQVVRVRFTGEPGMDEELLRDALASTRSRRLLPGLPGLWEGWRLHPPFSRSAVEADRERLQRFYRARGYLEAQVRVAKVKFAGEDARVTFEVTAGPRYRVRRAEVAAGDHRDILEPSLAGAFPHEALCACFRQARRRAERTGALDFSARLEVAPVEPPPWAGLAGKEAAEAPWVKLAARVDTGPSYRVGRLEFRGNESFSDLTLRGAFTLQEGEVFDAGKLRESVARLDGMGFFEPLARSSVSLRRHPERRRVDLTVRVEESDRGRWTVAGPLGALEAVNPLAFTLTSRLPAWGRGALELSTYYGTVSVLGLSQPVLTALGLGTETRWVPLIGLQRPYLPGQQWQSGFLLAPQLGWRGATASYGLSHLRENLLRLLSPSAQADRAPLAVPLHWRRQGKPAAAATTPAGFLLCEAEPSRWRWLRTAGTTALGLVLGGMPL